MVIPVNATATQMEVFYFVCRERGIAPALPLLRPKMDQSTVTRSIQSFEALTGHPLFDRHPGGRLEPNAQGRALLSDLRVSFDPLARMRLNAEGKGGEELRIGASHFVSGNYLTGEIAAMEARFANDRLTTRAGAVDFLLDLLRCNELDVVIAAVDQPCPDFPHAVLMKLPPVLLVPAGLPIRHSAQLLAQSPIPYRLVCPPEEEGVSKVVSAYFAASGINWPCTLRAGATDLVPHMAETMRAIGLSLAVARLTNRPGLRVLPLRGCPPVLLVAQWNPRKTELVDAFLQQIRSAAPRIAKTLNH